MAGIYLHIPFCKQLCHYCAFHKSISLQGKDEMLTCLLKELELRRKYLDGEEVETIYFGGGTPSVYSPREIESMIGFIRNNFAVKNDAEITIEANPDDLTGSYLKGLAESAVNRLSIGIQSFHDEDLILMNRRHTGREAIDTVKRAQDKGFDNISVDLIYGVPGLTMDKWASNLENVFQLQIQHISSYHLMFDPNTVFTHKLNSGQLKEMEEGESLEQFKMLIDQARDNNFVHYEISNFCLDGMQSRHNTSYWQQKKYLGVGPSAHSYNLREREWNLSHNYKYIKSIEKGEVPSEIEKLTELDHYNDYVLTSLRTMWGLDLDFVRERFGEKFFEFCCSEAKKYLASSHVRIENGRVILTDKGVFVSNEIMSDFFWVDEE
ncbi:MAG: radical SAM family heme chaperone HemW [Marinifilaceae bacterium]